MLARRLHRYGAHLCNAPPGRPRRRLPRVWRARAAASADSIAYIKDGNVWPTTPDGARQYQVTTTGGYSDVSQADDGTMIALNGVRLHKLARDGTVARRLRHAGLRHAPGAVQEVLRPVRPRPSRPTARRSPTPTTTDADARAPHVLPSPRRRLDQRGRHRATRGRPTLEPGDRRRAWATTRLAPSARGRQRHDDARQPDPHAQPRPDPRPHLRRRQRPQATWSSTWSQRHGRGQPAHERRRASRATSASWPSRPARTTARSTVYCVRGFPSGWKDGEPTHRLGRCVCCDRYGGPAAASGHAVRGRRRARTVALARCRAAASRSRPCRTFAGRLQRSDGATPGAAAAHPRRDRARLGPAPTSAAARPRRTAAADGPGHADDQAQPLVADSARAPPSARRQAWTVKVAEQGQAHPATAKTGSKTGRQGLARTSRRPRHAPSLKLKVSRKGKLAAQGHVQADSRGRHQTVHAERRAR